MLSKEEFCPANDNQGISRDAAAVSLQGMVRFGNRQFCRVVEKCHTVVSSSAFFCCSEGVGLSLSLALPVRDIRTKVIFISEIAPSSHCDHLFRIGFSVGWFLWFKQKQGVIWKQQNAGTGPSAGVGAIVVQRSPVLGCGRWNYRILFRRSSQFFFLNDCLLDISNGQQQPFRENNNNNNHETSIELPRWYATLAALCKGEISFLGRPKSDLRANWQHVYFGPATLHETPIQK